MEIGVFIPIGNNGWLISSTSPQYTPSFDLNREVVLRAEKYGFDFALSMIKLRGFGGKSRYWDDNLESFTLMAGLASITSRIELYATVAVLTMPPPLTARMAMTIDSISHGRFGVNLVTGWQKARVRPDGHLAGRRALQASLRAARRVRHRDGGAVGRRGQSDLKGTLLHHERLPPGACCRRGRIPHDLRRHQRRRHEVRRPALRLQFLQRQRRDEQSARLRRCRGAAQAPARRRPAPTPRRWRSP